MNIPRMEVAEVTLTEERAKLVQQFRKTFAVDSVKMAGQPSIGIAQMLMKLGITPLQSGAVEQYKVRAANRAQLMANKWRNLAKLWAIMGVPMVVGLGILVSGNNSWWLAAALVVVIVTTIACLIGLGETQRIEMQWMNCPISHWQRPLPEFVMATAITVKEQTGYMPRVEFLEARRSMHRDPDPFLCVEIDRQVVYLEVWDEREFEKTL